MASRGSIRGDELYNVGALRNVVQEEINELLKDPKKEVEIQNDE